MNIVAKGKKEGAKLNTMAWMTTFTDLVTLLLTFFVLLLSISTIDSTRKMKALKSLVGAFGFKPGAHSIIGSPKGLNITVGAAPMKEEDIQFEQLQNIAMRTRLESDVTIIKENEKIIITLSNRILFTQGSSRIDPESHKLLSELSDILREGSHLIELRGYTSHAETVFEPDILRKSMHLSSKRAFAVYHFFREKGEIPARKMVAHGFGIARGKGSAKKKRELNRQVQIILDYRERIPYRLKKHRRGSSLLDFKGFFFKIPGDDNE